MSIGWKPEVAGGEVELLVETRVVRDVHLAIAAGGRAVGVEDHRGVVVQPGGATLEQRTDQHHAVLLGELAEALGAGAGDRFGQVEFVDRFVLAEVGAVVQFLQQHELGALLRCFGHALLDHRQVGIGVAMVALLDQRDGEGGLLHDGSGSVDAVIPRRRGSSDFSFSHVNVAKAAFTRSRPWRSSLVDLGYGMTSVKPGLQAIAS